MRVRGVAVWVLGASGRLGSREVRLMPTIVVRLEMSLGFASRMHVSESGRSARVVSSRFFFLSRPGWLSYLVWGLDAAVQLGCGTWAIAIVPSIGW